MPLGFGNLNLLRFTEGSGQPLTAAWLCFEAEVWVSSPIAANAFVGGSYSSVSLKYSLIFSEICPPFKMSRKNSSGKMNQVA